MFSLRVRKALIDKEVVRDEVKSTVSSSFLNYRLRHLMTFSFERLEDA